MLMQESRKRKATLADRFWLFVGCGLLGFITSYVIYLKAFGPEPAHFWLVTFPIAFGACCGLGGVIWPDHLLDFLGQIWGA